MPYPRAAAVVHNELRDMTVHVNVIQGGQIIQAETSNGNPNF
ncbi:hypothetical protein ACIGXI_12850 [Kitasatospora aureofaciens]